MWIMHWNKELLIYNQYDVTITFDALCVTTLTNSLPKIISEGFYEQKCTIITNQNIPREKINLIFL